MKKSYFQPEIEVQKYSVPTGRFITTSEPEVNKENDLNNDDNYNYFGKK